MDAMLISASTSPQARPRFVVDPKTWHFYATFLSLLLLLTIGVRASAWRHWRTGAIESEGAEYARIAENLRNGRGYVGISTPGTQLVFPPLLPALIAATSLVTHNDYELAGRLVSFLLGVLLPLPVFGLAIRLFHWRTAAIAAIITAFYPLFVNLSFTVFSEGPYVTVLLSGVYLVLRAFDLQSITRWSLVGGAFGLAYLMRQEAVGPFIIAVLLGLMAGDATPGVKLKRAAAALTVFIVLALPQMLLIYRSTGKLRLEGKSTINYAWGIRALAERADSGSKELSIQDVDYDAANSINDRLEGTGVGMRPNADVIRETHMRLGDLVRFFRESIRRNTPELLAHLRERWLGAPFLPALALLGALRRPWTRQTALHHMFFILVPATAIVTTFTVVHAIYVRNYFILTPFLIIWGANGFLELARWTNRNIAVAFQSTNPWVPGVVVSAFMAIIMLGYALKETRTLFVFQEGSPVNQKIKDTGTWIKQQQTRRVRVMDALDTVAFHADADYVHVPSCNGELALRYIEKEKVDYVILHRGFEPTKYYKDWLISGIPDARAQLVYTTAEDDPSKILVFRWQQLATNRP